ncbi:two-component regulator propeller domain-containing protein [Lentimicrobium sp.]|uniref:type IX secretion system anionic LPS delivery protein PorZ n=1 Tax=Lentimicrobium sp. TaxID=2034841 RepID=UPI00345EC021
MRKAVFYLVIFFQAFLFLPFTGLSQEIGIGEWRDHLPYRKVIAVAEGNGKIYAATPYSLFYYDINDNSLNRLSKYNGLSDVGISSIKYNESLNTLVIAYTNANIDLLRDGEIINLSDIKRKPILGNKTINRIVFIGKRAYLACGFGIVVLDIEREEFPEPIYYIGTQGSAININDITYNPVDSVIYAATDEGIYRAPFYGSNLADYRAWSRESSFVLPSATYNHIAALNNRIYANKKGPSYATDAMFVKIDGVWEPFQENNTSNRSSLEVHYDRLVVCNNLSVELFRPDGSLEHKLYTYNPGNVIPKDAILDKDGNVWVGDEFEGLVRISDFSVAERFLPDGPGFPDVYAMASGKNDVWIVPGGRNSSFGAIYRQARFTGFVDGKWKTIDQKQDTLLEDMRDVLSVAVDPANHKRVYLGTWGYGLLEYENEQFSRLYTSENSSLEGATVGSDWYGIGGLSFDEPGNLWVTNSSAPSVLSVRKNNGEWKSFNLGSVASGVDIGRVAVDKSGQKWLMPRDHALIVFNDNNTLDDPSDDKVKKLTSVAGNGNLPGSFILSMAVDREGLVWVGSNEGVAVFYSPANIFSGQNFDAQRILIEQDGYGQYLLEAEAVTAIAVDGSNRKWFGTDRAGVFLMSADGTKEILHFTEENSPLLSNSITDITINESGEVFFGTSQGVISYRSESVTPTQDLKEVVVFPNPVRESYEGAIAIRGLVENSSVKITDISGNIVYSTLSEGGQALWNGRNFKGDRVNTGVYLVYVTNSDGSKTTVTKIMFVN